MYGIEKLDPGYVRFFSAIEEWAGGRDDVIALFVSGSVATNTADEFSDLDLLLITDSASIEATMDEAASLLRGIEPCIIENRLGSGESRVLSVVTHEWHRVDIQVGTPNSPLLKQVLLPVFDHESLYEGAPAADRPPPDPARLTSMVTEFLRVLGLSVVVLGREDVHAAHDGANLLRGHLVDLFLMEPDAGRRSSAKKLRPALTDEHQSLLRSLPPLADDRGRIVAFSEAIARIFLPRARTLLESWGGTWPVEIEEATRHYLEQNRALSI